MTQPQPTSTPFPYTTLFRSDYAKRAYPPQHRCVQHLQHRHSTDRSKQQYTEELRIGADNLHASTVAARRAIRLLTDGTCIGWRGNGFAYRSVLCLDRSGAAVVDPDVGGAHRDAG